MKVNVPLKYISLSLLVIITMCLSREVRADPVTIAPAASISVTSAVLTVSSGKIDCGKSATFTLTLKGAGSNTRPVNLVYEVFQDGAGDDKLIGTTTFTVTGDAEGKWEEELTFTLECTGDCILRGAGGSSGDKVAKVLAKIKLPLGDELGKSNSVDVECVPTPEPATMSLLGMGLAGIAIKMRKRLKSPKSGEGSQ